MGLYLKILIAFSAVSFLFFGYACLTSPFMVAEFKRYGLGRFRVSTGYLQLIGALTLLAGYWHEIPLLLGSGGLALLMFLGLLVRIRIKDGIVKSSPAFFYMVLNSYIFYTILQS